ncbi:DUF4304 domain-containing protein [Paenibacillus sp. LHD-38]|uniref:DUF4304 domain-containing protein n=1 Tax=Paenibacillus sp. LHD-38 TaxID=3072143 RepID=UPI00280CB950|nr:DUF4304 domain-containing protein [Paenibacillus sp. LHD-38]MDQ8735970.1 DUF4304 domain-containing protein [Paenibacillus sp. LHD-38]
MSINYSDLLNEMISNLFESKFLELGFKRSKNTFSRNVNGIRQVCQIQKSRSNSSMFVSFTIGVGVNHPDFAKSQGTMLKFDPLLISIPMANLVEKALQKKTYLNWYRMGDIPGFAPYGGLSEDTFDLEDPFTRYDRIWKDPNKLAYIINQDINLCIIPFFESTDTEAKVVKFVEANQYYDFLSELGRLFIDEKSDIQ